MAYAFKHHCHFILHQFEGFLVTQHQLPSICNPIPFFEPHSFGCQRKVHYQPLEPNTTPSHTLLIFHFPIRTTDEGAVKNCIPHTPAQKMRPQRANQAEEYLSKSYLSMPRWQRLIVVSCCWCTNHGWVPPKTLAKNGCQRKFVESCHLTGDLILSWPDVLLHRS